jgi:hypothetical protein
MCTAEVVVHMNMTPDPFPVCVLLSVPRYMIGPNKSTATD